MPQQDRCFHHGRIKRPAHGCAPARGQVRPVTRRDTTDSVDFTEPTLPLGVFDSDTSAGSPASDCPSDSTPGTSSYDSGSTSSYDSGSSSEAGSSSCGGDW